MTIASLFLKANNASASLASAITNVSSTMTVTAGHTLPAISGSFRVIIWDIIHYQTPFLDPNVEIVTASYVSPNVYSIIRAQEDTLAVAHPANSEIAMTFTAGTAINDLSILGTHALDETNISPGYFIWFNGATNNYELHEGATGPSTLPFGLFANRPASPVVGDWYLATDTQILYTCYTTNVWTPYSGNHGIEVFTASGTFVAPAGVTRVYVSMVGGGGGGGGTTNDSTSIGGGGGGSGAYLIDRPHTVIPGNSYTVTIPAAAVGGADQDTDGATGGTVVFDTLSVLGGAGGVKDNPGTGGAGGAASMNAVNGTPGVGALAGGTGGTKTGTNGMSGAGGSSPLGIGAAGTTSGNGIDGDANTGGGGSGAGGGGAGNKAGGSGGTGIVIIKY